MHGRYHSDAVVRELAIVLRAERLSSRRPIVQALFVLIKEFLRIHFGYNKYKTPQKIILLITQSNELLNNNH